MLKELLVVEFYSDLVDLMYRFKLLLCALGIKPEERCLVSDNLSDQHLLEFN